MLTRARFLVLLALAACDVRTRSERRWIGTLTAANAQPCPPTRGVLLMRENQVTFAPDEGTWVLTGTATPAGVIQAARSRRSGSQNYETSFAGNWTESRVEGTYTTPRCTYHTDLKRQ